MPASTFQVTFDAADPDALAHFWAEAIGYKLQDPPEGFDSWEAWLEAHGIPNNNDASAIVDPDGVRPRFYFQRVPEPKSGKNRVHLDVTVAGARGVSEDERKRMLEVEASRLTGLGATRVEYFELRGESWIIMRDPEGNEFCLQ